MSDGCCIATSLAACRLLHYRLSRRAFLKSAGCCIANSIVASPPLLLHCLVSCCVAPLLLCRPSHNLSSLAPAGCCIAWQWRRCNGSGSGCAAMAVAVAALRWQWQWRRCDGSGSAAMAVLQFFNVVGVSFEAATAVPPKAVISLSV